MTVDAEKLKSKRYLIIIILMKARLLNLRSAVVAAGLMIGLLATSCSGDVATEEAYEEAVATKAAVITLNSPDKILSGFTAQFSLNYPAGMAVSNVTWSGTNATNWYDSGRLTFNKPGFQTIRVQGRIGYSGGSTTPFDNSFTVYVYQSRPVLTGPETVLYHPDYTAYVEFKATYTGNNPQMEWDVVAENQTVQDPVIRYSSDTKTASVLFKSPGYYTVRCRGVESGHTSYYEEFQVMVGVHMEIMIDNYDYAGDSQNFFIRIFKRGEYDYGSSAYLYEFDTYVPKKSGETIEFILVPGDYTIMAEASGIQMERVEDFTVERGGDIYLEHLGGTRLRYDYSPYDYWWN